MVGRVGDDIYNVKPKAEYKIPQPGRLYVKDDMIRASCRGEVILLGTYMDKYDIFMVAQERENADKNEPDSGVQGETQEETEG